jgi:[pyruvate, water dikinase]-phosphate phosphotransferase / [pyruvate, water dikinase] kinase
MSKFHLHLVSDATGETVTAVARAALVQFEGAEAIEHLWTLVRTRGQLMRVVERIAEHPGLVMFTVVDHVLRELLIEECRRRQIVSVSVLDPVLAALAGYLGAESQERPGGQHMLNAEYFHRIDAMQYCMSHDDGQNIERLNEADVVLVGVSRTSKTPTCIYLANRGIKAGNVPIVPKLPLPPVLSELDGPMVVGLTASPERLVQIRRNRLLSLKADAETDYVDMEAVQQETALARRLFAQNGWPVIDVTRRSIEETAAAVMTLLTRRRGDGG